LKYDTAKHQEFCHKERNNREKSDEMFAKYQYKKEKRLKAPSLERVSVNICHSAQKIHN
jgi:hypothetical protein